jgi:hypothetical protein
MCENHNPFTRWTVEEYVRIPHLQTFRVIVRCFPILRYDRVAQALSPSRALI